jgi:hypothetical protein
MTIGFAHRAPESAETKMGEEKRGDGSTVIFTETRHPEGCGFDYCCERVLGGTKASVSQSSTKRLAIDQVKQLQRIAKFLAVDWEPSINSPILNG